MTTLIYNVTQLQAMNDDLTLDYELGNDINASATSGWNSGRGFIPIGTAEEWNDTFEEWRLAWNGFTGSFDGKGYTINDLYINRPNSSGLGLFGYTADGCGTIQNVGIIDCNMTGRSSVAALLGFQDDYGGTISNCWSSGSIAGVVTSYKRDVVCIAGLIGLALPHSSASFLDCHSSCSVTATNTGERLGSIGGSSGCGGLIGTLYTEITVTRCYATGNVTASSLNEDVDSIGGFIGSMQEATITKCYATGNISCTADRDAKSIGGFVGDVLFGTAGDVSDCYARGDITAVAGIPEDSHSIGGFVGLVDTDFVVDNCYSTGSLTVTGGVPYIGGFCGYNFGTITNCFWDTQTSGQPTSDGGTGKTTAEMKTRATFTDAGWDFDTIWHITANRNNGYPILRPPGFGHGWVEGNYMAFIAELGKQKILGTDTTTDAIAGHGSIEGDFFHYLDSSGDERRQRGKATGATGVAGHGWIDDLRLRIIDSSGNVRYLGTWILGQSKLGIDTILHG